MRVIDWIDERTGIRGLLSAFGNRGVPRGVGWWYIFGSATLLTLVVQVATGLALTLDYVPSPDQAYESVQYITNQVLFGGFVRGLHHWSASAFVLLLFLHLLRTLFFGAFKYPRELNWLIGVGLFMLGLGLALSGYLLPWDQRAYWGTVVSTEAAGSIPLIGPWILRLARGGADVGPVTLTRFFSLHIMWLPIGVATLVICHLYLVIRQGISNPPERGVAVPTDPAGYQAFYGERKKGAHTFYPEVILKDTIAYLVIFAVLVALAVFVGAPLEPRADPTATNYIPRPEWYFLFLFQFLRLLKPAWEIIGTTVAPLLAIVILVLLPFLDRSRYRHPLDRPIVSGVATLVVIGLVFLSVQGALAPAPESAPVARLVIAHLTPIEEQGQALYKSLACSVCHAVDGVGGTRGPDLAGIGAQLTPQQLINHLQPKAGSSLMPNYSIGNQDLISLAAYLMTLTTPPTQPVTPTVPLPKGEELYLANGCPACHTIDNVGGTIGPDLSSEGARHDEAWLVQFLQNPSVMLPQSSMPAHPLNPDDLTAIAGYLAGLKAGAATGPSVDAGLNLYNGQGCSVCHMVQGRGGTAGPDLTHIGDKLDESQLAQYIHDPKSVNPSSAMPPYGNLSDVQLQSLALYMLSLVGKAPAALPSAPATSAAATPAAAASAAPATPGVTSAVTATTAAPAGAEAFGTNCAGCHGDKGQGGAVAKQPIPVDRLTDAQLTSIVTQGRGSMPSFGGRLSAAVIDSIVAFMRSWQAGAPAASVAAAPAITSTTSTSVTPAASAAAAAPAVTSTASMSVTTAVTSTAGAAPAADGATLFATNCAGCHGDKGQGGAVAKEPIEVGADARLTTIITQGRGQMPGFGSRLSAADVAALIAFMQSWQAAAPAPSPAATLAVTSTASMSATAAMTATAASAPAADGATLFATNCAGCHGDKGQGGPVATEPINAARLTETRLTTIVTQGRGASMPAFSQLSAADISALLAFLQGGPAPSVGGTPAVTSTATVSATTAMTSTAGAAPAADGATLFATNCAGCHGDKGQGGAVATEPIEVGTDARLTTIITQGRGAMPAFGSRLSAGDVAALIAFMRSWK